MHLDVILVNDQLDALFSNLQVGPPDDEHLLLETFRGFEINTLEKSASSWSLTKIM